MIRKVILPVISGALLAAAFPPFGQGWLAWVAMVPLFYAMETKKKEGWRHPLTAGYVFGAAFFLATVYWVIHSMYHYGGMGLATSVPVMVLLVLFLALYAGAFGLAFHIVRDRGVVVRLLALPAAWVALEYFRAHLFTGFPWVLAGYSQVPYAPMIQVADMAGVWGVSYLVVLLNAGVYLVLRNPSGRRGGARASVAAVVFAVLTLTLAYGFITVNGMDERTAAWKRVTAGVAQGSVDQSVKWDAGFRTTTIDIYDDLTRKAAADGAELVVWPETAVPFYLGADRNGSDRVEEAAREAGTWILTGSPSFSMDLDTSETEYFNSAYLLSPTGGVRGRYDKVHLVPFGEYVPMKRLLFFVSKLTEGVGDFSSGPGTVPISFDGSGIGVLICYESIFPELSAGFVGEGAGLLVNITNDAWFGRTAAPYQHFEMSVMRAVENRTYLLRAANTGISAAIDPAGRVLARTPLFERVFFTEEVGLREGEPTLYTRYTDYFAYICIVFSGLAVMSGVSSRRYF